MIKFIPSLNNIRLIYWVFCPIKLAFGRYYLKTGCLKEMLIMRFSRGDFLEAMYFPVVQSAIQKTKAPVFRYG